MKDSNLLWRTRENPDSMVEKHDASCLVSMRKSGDMGTFFSFPVSRLRLDNVVIVCTLQDIWVTFRLVGMEIGKGYCRIWRVGLS